MTVLSDKDIENSMKNNELGWTFLETLIVLV